ncbi:MAG: hypothetical protein COB78_05795 [Hyphomicrobiales bacterium]|nr:MAG: hypothetical protein COB78_05795 [Hyphomicrobiales bacterium]
MKEVIFALAILLGSTGISAAEGSFVAKDAGKQFIAAATDFGIKNMAAEQTTCRQKKYFTCQFDTAGNIVLVAAAENENAPIKSIGLYFVKDSDPTIFFASVGALIGLLDPQVSMKDRQRIAKKLIDGAPKSGATELGSNYAIQSSSDRSVGIRVIAQFL